MKILIAVPTFENIYPDTYKSIFDMDWGDHEIIFEYVRGYDCATARNRIAQRSLDLGVDYVLMIDNDMAIPRDALLRLLDDPVDVCLGYYAHRPANNKYNGRLNICKLGEFNFSTGFTAKELKDMKARGIKKFEVHGGGMGCALIKASVFNKIAYPWFDWVNYADENRGVLSEDLYFCVQCKKAGIPVHSDARVGCGHLLRYIQWPE